MIEAKEAIREARLMIGTPYRELDCIGLIVRVIRTAPGGVEKYRTAGTNSLWRSIDKSAKYRDLTWRQEGLTAAAETSSVSPSASHLPHGGRRDAQAGMLAFKRSGTDVHHVGLVTGEGTVIHSSSAKGCVVETALDGSWQLLAVHRYIEALLKAAAPTAPSGGSLGDKTEETRMEAYKMVVAASSLNVRNEPGVGGTRIGRLGEGAVVTVVEEFDNGWRRIVYGDSGYVDGSYLGKCTEMDVSGTQKITIVDSAGNHFCPVGDWRVIVGSID